MTWTVHHYFPATSGNVGDGLVAHALQQAFRRHFGPTDFVPVPVNERSKSMPITVSGANASSAPTPKPIWS